jgi:hypothetical protein
MHSETREPSDPPHDGGTRRKTTENYSIYFRKSSFHTCNLGAKKKKEMKTKTCPKKTAQNTAEPQRENVNLM